MFYLNKPFILMTSVMLMTSSIMAMSSTNWIFLWMSMEINMLSFIPMMTNSKINQETEASIKYFMAQALGSSIMLMTSMSQWSFSMPYVNIILMSAILLKLGMVPFHFWFPVVMTSLSWFSCMILATWQKLAPLIILSFMLNNNMSVFIVIAALNALLGGMMGMNQSHLRTIMAYSSITHMGWMSSLLFISKPFVTMTYYMMYCAITIPLFMIMYFSNQYSNSQFNKLSMMSPSLQLIIPIMLLSLSGMPPLTGFIPKWLTIMNLAQSSPMILMILILGAMMNMYFYMNIVFNSILSLNSFMANSSMFKFTMKLPLVIATVSLSLLPLIMI